MDLVLCFVVAALAFCLLIGVLLGFLLGYRAGWTDALVAFRAPVEEGRRP